MAQTRSVVVADGAGFIRSHTGRTLAHTGRTAAYSGYDPFVAGNLPGGAAQAPDDVPSERGDIGDPEFMGDLLRRGRPACLMHLAAPGLVGESMAQPRRHWRTNPAQTPHRLDSRCEHEVACHRTAHLS